MEARGPAVWAAFAMVGLLVAVSGMVVFGGLFFAPHADTAIKLMVEGRIISRAVILFLVIPTVAILCIENKVSGEAALATLSAIAGYILGAGGQ